jgi:hypothetical protein
MTTRRRGLRPALPMKALSSSTGHSGQRRLPRVGFGRGGNVPTTSGCGTPPRPDAPTSDAQAVDRDWSRPARAGNLARSGNTSTVLTTDAAQVGDLCGHPGIR